MINEAAASPKSRLLSRYPNLLNIELSNIYMVLLAFNQKKKGVTTINTNDDRVINYTHTNKHLIGAGSA